MSEYPLRRSPTIPEKFFPPSSGLPHLQHSLGSDMSYLKLQEKSWLIPPIATFLMVSISLQFLWYGIKNKKLIATFDNVFSRWIFSHECVRRVMECSSLKIECSKMMLSSSTENAHDRIFSHLKLSTWQITKLISTKKLFIPRKTFTMIKQCYLATFAYFLDITL